MADEKSRPPPWPPLAAPLAGQGSEAERPDRPPRTPSAGERTDFPIVLRGYDRDAVDAYVARTNQHVAELQATHSPEAAVKRALERVGEDVSGILERAHETAEQLTSSARRDADETLHAARREAEELLEGARRQSAEITSGSEQRLKALDAETDRIWGERHQIVEDARALASQLLSLADSASERFPADEEDATLSRQRDPDPDETAAMPPLDGELP